VAFVSLALLACGNAATSELTVGAASSLRPLLDEVVVLFEEETGISVQVSYGASGAIARQIEQGAPIDVFASADVAQIDELTLGEFLVSDSIFAWGNGQLVLVQPIDADRRIETLLDADRIAIANPETAPYGAAAKLLMQRNGVWDEVEDNVVFAETALQALLFAQAGEVDFAFVPLSLVRANDEGVRVVDLGLPISSITFLTQTLAVISDSASLGDARRFVEFFATDEIVRLFWALGYTPAIELIRGTDAR
jgi:molybdate transport system substrate-binding protein